MLKSKTAFKIYKKALRKSFPYFFKTLNDAIKRAASLGDYEVDIFVTDSSLRKGLINIIPYLESLGYIMDIDESIYYPEKNIGEKCIVYEDSSLENDLKTFNKSKGGMIHIIFSENSL